MSWRVTSSARHVLRRQKAPPIEREQREYVEEMIRFLQRSQDYYADPEVPVDQALASRVLDGWYTAATAQEQIALGLGEGGDPLLVRELRAAYSVAVTTLLTRAADQAERPLSELYGINRGRIPMWAWQESHQQLPGISTPVAEGPEVDVTGSVNVPVRGMSASILPDAPDPKLGDRDETQMALRWERPQFSWAKKRGVRVVTAMKPVQSPSATIQTFFGPQVTAASPSGYGRGTTPEDVAGAAVDPRSGTLGFHEGQHGLDYVEFLQAHPPPVFGGRLGMTGQQFRAAGRQWSAAMKEYEKQALHADSRSLAGDVAWIQQLLDGRSGGATALD